MGFVEWIGSNFIGIFEEAARIFISMFSALVPLLLIMLVFTDSITIMIGNKQIKWLIKKIAKLPILNISLLPVLSALFLRNPLAYSSSKYLKEKEKTAFYDALVSFIHPVTALVPSSNPAEIFVFWSITYGVIQSGNNFSSIAIRYFICGIFIACFRGIFTYFFYQWQHLKVFRKKSIQKV